MSDDRGDLLASLIARQEIKECIYRYARAVDDRDPELLATCFHEDSDHEHGAFKGKSRDFCGFAIDLVSRCDCTQHMIGNVSITVEGSTAQSSAYFFAYHRMPADAPPVFAEAQPGDDVFIGGRYIDRFELRAGLWRIVNRYGARDWARFDKGDDRGLTKALASGFDPAIAARIFGPARVEGNQRHGEDN